MTFFTSLPAEVQVKVLEIAESKAGIHLAGADATEQLTKYGEQFKLVLQSLMEAISSVDVE